MTHPILGFMPAVFVPVRDLQQAIEWYSKLLGRAIAAKEDEDGIYIFAMGGTHLILDGNALGTPPRIMFATDDIEASHAVCESLQHNSLTDVFSDDYVSVFTINSHMICKAKRDLGLPGANTNVLLGRINRILLHSDSLEDSVSWHEALLAKSSQTDPQFGELPCIRMDQGPDLLFDDNRLSQSPRIYFEQLQLDIRANPIAVIESPDLPAALEHVLSQGATADKGIESRFNLQFFVFYDPDGNGYLVCEAL